MHVFLFVIIIYICAQAAREEEGCYKLHVKKGNEPCINTPPSFVCAHELRLQTSWLGLGMLPSLSLSFTCTPVQTFLPEEFNA